GAEPEPRVRAFVTDQDVLGRGARQAYVVRIEPCLRAEGAARPALAREAVADRHPLRLTAGLGPELSTRTRCGSRCHSHSSLCRRSASALRRSRIAIVIRLRRLLLLPG